MKLMYLLPLIFLAGPAHAQYEPPSVELTPNERIRYGSSLWEVPREPYQSRYRAERDASGLMTAPPDETARPERSQERRGGGVHSPINTAPAESVGERKTRQRFQSRMQWENEQRKISERSRYSVPNQKSSAGK